VLGVLVLLRLRAVGEPSARRILLSSPPLTAASPAQAGFQLGASRAHLVSLALYFGGMW